MTKFVRFFNGKKSKTINEALKKKKISKIGIAIGVLLIFVNFAIIFVVSKYTDFDTVSLIMPLSLVCVLVIMFFWLKLNCARKEIFVLKNQYCLKCGERYRAENAGYLVLSDKVFTSKKDNYIQADTYTYVKIKCTCANCNNEHIYQYEFLTKREKTNFYGAKLSEENYPLTDRLIEHFDW